LNSQDPKTGTARGEPSPGGLLRRLGLFDCTMIVMGTIIGAGVFQTPSPIAAQMGSLWGILGLWIAGGVIAMCGALVFAELGSLLPRAGGQYIFLREGFGRFVAFLFGWLLLAAINSAAIAYVANVFVDHLQALLAYGGRDPAWSQLGRRVVAALGIVGLALVNIRGVRFGASVQNVAMLAKISGIITIVVLGGLVWAGTLTPSAPATTATHDWTWAGLGASLLGVVFTYGGWQNVTAVAGEVRDPERTIPRGILIGTVLVIGLYLAMNAALVAILGVEGVAATATPAATAAGRAVAWGEPLVAALVMISTAAIAQALLFVTPRIYYAMALDGVFFRAAAHLHPRWRTPIVAIGLQAGFSLLHLCTGSKPDLLEMTTIVDFSFFVLCGLALFRFRRTMPDAPRAYKAFGYPWLPALFTLGSAAVVINGVFNAQRLAVYRAAGIVALGVLLFAFWARSPRPEGPKA
jgi:APA family basic amino acid/polyamine antiporter